MSRSGRAVSVVLAGGGTAGHIEPALAVADALTAIDPEVRITVLGTARGLETRLVTSRGYRLELITPVPLPRTLTPDLLRLPWRLRRSVVETRHVLAAAHADVIVGFGGYVAVPAYLAGRGMIASPGRFAPARRVFSPGRFAPARRVFSPGRFAPARRGGIPIVVHEANARAGLANRLGARAAHRVLAAVPDSGLGGAEVVGMPLRASITGLDRAALRSAARQYFGFGPDVPVLLVFGGSQGAASINRAVSGAAEALADAGVAVLHAHGPKNSVTLPQPRPGDAPYLAVPYLDRMDLAYAAADLAICRSGAMTVAEVSAVGLPAVYVPLPIGNGEQRLNAQPVVGAGGGLLVEDADLSPEFVATQVVPLINDRSRLATMTAAAAGAGHREAAHRVAEIVLDVARAGRTRTEAGR